MHATNHGMVSEITLARMPHDGLCPLDKLKVPSAG